MEELIPFIFFVVWILFSGVGSKKKREEVARRQREARAQAEADRAARAEQRRAMRESREADGRVTFPEAQTAPSDSSLDMIPDELWDILTGGAPRPTRPQQAPQPTPPADGGWVTSPPWDEEDAVHSIEGVSAEDTGEDVVDYDDEASSVARARYEDLRDTTWDEHPSRDAVAVRVSETADSRHVDFHDRLRATEIGDAVVDEPLTTAGSLRGGLRRPADVRRAIVLAEILGPPKSLR